MLMEILESLLAFFNREYISYSAQYISKKYWQEYHNLIVLRCYWIEIEVAIF